MSIILKLLKMDNFALASSAVCLIFKLDHSPLCVGIPILSSLCL